KRRMLSLKGGTESVLRTTASSDHPGRCARILLEVKARRTVAVSGADDVARRQRDDDDGDHCPRCRALDRPGLTGGAGGVVVEEMRPRSARLHVRRHPGVAALHERRNGDDELRRDRQEGEDGEQPMAIALLLGRGHYMNGMGGRLAALAGGTIRERRPASHWYAATGGKVEGGVETPCASAPRCRSGQGRPTFACRPSNAHAHTHITRLPRHRGTRRGLSLRRNHGTRGRGRSYVRCLDGASPRRESIGDARLYERNFRRPRRGREVPHRSAVRI